ncbi:MAG: Na+/H+ antiporter NhaA [Archangiaceae bacterium]|nr:Na+/H+ antiporter NhaA [Archangiaceae bacterium]
MPSTSPLRAVLRPFQKFVQLEASSGVLLFACAAAALAWANVDAASYRAVFGYRPWGAGFSLREVIDDGLMAVFFLVVGAEIKRELVSGAMDSVAKAALPAAAAVGGMVVPALVFLVFAHRPEVRSGWGVPMATDIAFCVGVLKLLEKRVPRELVVFVTALAIFDDIGGILVIAVFYGHGLSVAWLLAAAAVVAVLGVMNWRGVTGWWLYALVGVALWFALHRGGIHATLSGVVVGLMIPTGAHGDRDPLHPYVAFGVMPLFALANSGLELGGLTREQLSAEVVWGVGLGLFIGKQLGIFSVAALAVKLKLAPMPGGASYRQLYGVSVVAGIGFTVALFIANLAYADPMLLDEAKLGVLAGSLAAGVVGAAVLRASRPATAR